MKNYETLATREYDQLLTSPLTHAIIGAAKLDESAQSAERGTLLGFEEAGGALKIYDGSEGMTPCAILVDDANGEEVARIYTKGTFNIDAVIVGDDYEITDADIDTLRKYDIHFDKAVY